VSVENLKKYGQLCADDEKVRNKAKEIGLKDLEGQIAHGKSLGLEFSREDFEALAREAGLEKKDELSEEDLKKVAGGFLSTTGLVLVGLGVAATAGAGSAALVSKPGW
jgi:predicted ribosomally synthesized peptide with nif11-like leader